MIAWHCIPHQDGSISLVAQIGEVSLSVHNLRTPEQCLAAIERVQGHLLELAA